MNKQSSVNFKPDKTVEKGSFIKRQKSGKSSDSEWYNKNVSDYLFTVDDFFSFSLINIPSITSRVLHLSFFRSSHRRCFVTYSSSHNLTPAISRVMIGQHLIFYSPPWLKCCNSPRKCTPVKYKARQKAGFPIVTYTTSEEKVFLEISQNSQENNCVRIYFLIKLQAKKKRLWHRCFPVNFVKLLRTPFLQNISGRLFLFFLSNFSQIVLLIEIPTSYFIRKCDICEVLEVWWERMRLKILIL